MNHMIVQHEEISHNNSNEDSNHSNHINSSKGTTINVTKAVVRKSILMQTTRAKAANSFH